MRRIAVAGVVATAALAGTAAQAQGFSDAGGPSFVPGEALVQFEAGVPEGRRALALGRAGAVVSETVRDDAAQGRLELVSLPPGAAVRDAVRELARDASIRFAEPNWVYRHHAVPNDPSFGQLWGLHNTGQSVNGGAPGTPDADLDAPEAWDLSTGSPLVYVGVIDEGIDVRHPDLAGVVINPGEDADGDGRITSADFNRVDDDGNGFVDDVYGWDFANGDNTVFDGKSRASRTDAHGTHVSGTIGAVGSNATGVAGVNWRVRIVSAKFLGPRGGTTANAVRALDYLVGLRQRGVNLVASNNSWGGGGYSQALADAIGRSAAAGMVFVAAAGNGGSDGVGDDNDRTPSYPASYADASVIAVAALTPQDRLASFSNFGAVSVDVAAPGTSILSTLPFGSYGFYSGTSMATPHVTGLCALLAADEPGLAGAQIRQRVLDTVVQTPALAGKVATGGRVNAWRALAATTAVDP